MIGLIKGTMRSKKALAGLPAPIASFRTNGNSPLTACKVSIAPVQAGSGDPSPSNPRPISGWDSVKVSATGKNFIDPTLLKDQAGWNTFLLKMKPNTTYTCQANFVPADSNLVLFMNNQASYGSGVSVYSGHTVTVTTDSSGLLYFQQRRISGTDSFSNYEIQVEEGSQATAYEPFGQTATITLPHTVYGAEHDVDSGKLKITHKYQDLGDISWTPYNGTFYAQLENAKTPSSISTVADIICSQYKADTLNHVLGKTTDGIIAINDQQSRVHIYDSAKSSMTGADFKTAMSGVQLVYELATPIEIDLTPAQLQARNGQNNVWADAGDISEIGYAVHQQYIGR